MHIKFLLFFFLIFITLSSHAYIGPGIGAGTLAAIAGVIVSLFAAIFAVTYYPIKRLLKRRKANKDKMAQEVPVNKDIDENKKRDLD